MRFFRFSSKYAKVIDKEGFNICIKFKSYIRELSQERIKAEMDRLVLNIEAPKILQLMNDYKILSEIFPIDSYRSDLHIQILLLCTKIKVSPSLPLIYYILFINNKNVTISDFINLKFSRSDAKILLKMRSFKNFCNSKQNIIFFLKKIWLEEKNFKIYFTVILLSVKDDSFLYEMCLNYINKSIPIFPITGKDILTLGYKDIDIGRILNYLKHHWINTNFQCQKDALLDMVSRNEK